MTGPGKRHVPLEQRKIEKLLVKLAKIKPISGNPALIAQGTNVLTALKKN